MKKSSRDARRHKRDSSHNESRQNTHKHNGHPRDEKRTGSSNRRRERFPREVAVLYEDDAVIVLNKPPGLLAVPIKRSHTPSALSLAGEELKHKRQRALIVHRIDRFVSGILLFAKTNQARDSLIKQFLAHTPVRQYLAVVRGQIEKEPATLVHYFRREGMFQLLRTAKDKTASRAELHYSAERVFRDASLVRVDLITGLQNQIRAQFAAIGHPIIGDRKYHQKEAEERLIDRVALHAAHLEFTHPGTGKTVTIDCEPPQDFQRLIRALERPGRPQK
jgi:23S rRNA pseudouridine1911/1915/1917 synthase